MPDADAFPRLSRSLNVPVKRRPVNLRLNRYETPHMLLEIDGTVFTSVMMFLSKTG